MEFRADSGKIRSSFYIEVFYYQSLDVSAGTGVDTISLAMCMYKETALPRKALSVLNGSAKYRHFPATDEAQCIV